MWRGIVLIAGVMGMAPILAGCGLADSNSSMPAFLRVSDSEPRHLDPQPDAGQLLRDKLDRVFVPESHPEHIQISALRREPSGPGWTVCVKADLTSVMGKPLGGQTYLVTIESNVIVDRRRSSSADDNCDTETYEPL